MDAVPREPISGRTVGRYVLYDELASGGMASVHLGRLVGPAGFARTVAIKRLHPHHAKDREFVAMLHDEARVAARVRHPNVVPMLDVVDDGDELLLVMELVHGESLAALFRATKLRGERVPDRIVRAILTSTLSALHAAHESTSELGEPLGIVHRDVSPQNVMVGVDGVVRVLDFGIAKAAGRLQTTESGEVKGKAAYMAPEQLDGEGVDRRTDVYAAAVMLWELVVGDRLFTGESPAAVMVKVLKERIESPRTRVPDLDPALDALIMKGLARAPSDRFATAHDMAIAIEALGPLATTREVGEWVESLAADSLRARASRIAEIESATFERPSRDDLPSSGRRAAFSRGKAAKGEGETEAEGRAPSPSLADGSAKQPWTQDTPAPASIQRRRASSGLLLLGVVLGVGLGGWLAVRNRDGARAPETSIEPPSAASAVTPAESARTGAGAIATAASNAEPSASASASAPASASVSASASASAPAPASSASAASAAVHSTPAVAPPGPATAKPRPPVPRGACDPPYTLDERGIRIPKAECL